MGARTDGVTKFDVIVSQSGGSADTKSSVDSPYTIDTLTAATSYTIKVVAVGDGNPNKSAESASQDITTFKAAPILSEPTVYY